MQPRLQNIKKNAGALVIDLSPEENKEFTDKLFTALRKFGTSKKTRAVHKIVKNNLVSLAVLGGEASELLIAVGNRGTTLADMVVNLVHYDDSVGSQGAVVKAMQKIEYTKKLRKEETFVNDAKLHQSEKLKEKIDEATTKLLDSLDYVKLIDGLYFGWLLFLSEIAVKEDLAGKPKIVTTGADILADLIKNLYRKVNSSMEPDVHQLIEAISIYFIKVYFYGESASYALNSLKKAFSDEVINAIERSKVTKFKEFGDIANLLKETELMPITPATFDLQMEKMFGKLGYREYVSASFISYLTFMANLAHPNGLFKDSYTVNDELHLRLEELLLNEQKKVVLKENKL